MRAQGLLAVGFMLATVAPAAAQDINLLPAITFPGVSLSSGIDYSSGRYGDPKSTDILVGLTSLSVSEGDFQFSASLPYLNITGPSYVVVGSGGVPVLINPQKSGGATVRSGWGDLNLGVTYSLPSDAFGDVLGDFDVAVSARTKVATADAAKGLSTGATDFAFSVDVSRQIGIAAPFVTFGYRVPGSPSFYAFNDAPSFSAGTSLELDTSLIAIISYDFDGSISPSLADAQQIFASVSWLLTDEISLTAYAEDGLSSGAPKEGTGLLLSWKVH